MSIFRPGLRVRIKYSVTWPEINGETGHIVQATDDVSPGEKCWDVHVDAWSSTKSISDGVELTFSPEEKQLEPIQPDSYTVVNWSDCLWNPKQKHNRRKRARDVQAVES